MMIDDLVNGKVETYPVERDSVVLDNARRNGLQVYYAHIKEGGNGRLVGGIKKVDGVVLEDVDTCAGLIIDGKSYFSYYANDVVTSGNRNTGECTVINTNTHYSKHEGKVVSSGDGEKFSCARKAYIMAHSTRRKVKIGGHKCIVFAVNNIVYLYCVEDGDLYKISGFYYSGIPLKRECYDNILTASYKRYNIGGIDVTAHSLIFSIMTDDEEMFNDYVLSRDFNINHCIYNSGDGSVINPKNKPDDMYDLDPEYFELVSLRENIVHGDVVNRYKLFNIPVTARSEYMSKLSERLAVLADSCDVHDDMFYKMCRETAKIFNQENGLFPNFVYE